MKLATRPREPWGAGGEARVPASAIVSVVVLGALAYVPALASAPGRMPSDSKLYLYLDPGRLIADAASSFDPRQFAGWVPHQHIAYLWPAGPWFWLFQTLGVPDWVAHRLWIGTLMVVAGLGLRWCARLLGLGPAAALTAAIVYQVSPYVLPYVSRTSVMLLPWAGLGWIVGLTIQASRRRTWRDPAAIALVVFTVGAVNATALAMIVPAPTLWVLHAVWQRSLTWRQALVVVGRVGVLAVPVSLWWIVALLLQGRHGAAVLPYSESLADVSLTATAPEVWRSLGYWLFYVRDSYAATTSESLRYLSSSPAIVISYAVPIVAVLGLVVTRWAHRRFAALCLAAGAVLAVGVHPIGDRSPLMRVLAGSDDGGLALALRSSTRALPVMNLGLALLAGALVSVCRPVRLRSPVPVAAPLVSLLAVLNLPALWTAGFVDPALERSQDPPPAWIQAAAELDRSGADGRVLQVPGAEFGAFRWGYTVDQPLPGLTDKPLVTRDLLPLGSPAAMDLLYALDDRIQSGTLEPSALAPVARLLGVDLVWLANDLADDRFRTARPASVAAQVLAAPGIADPVAFGEPTSSSVVDERSIGEPAARTPRPEVELFALDEPGRIVRAGAGELVVSGSGDGLVDLAAVGMLDAGRIVHYTASLDDRTLAETIRRAGGLVITDSHRARPRHWRSSQDTLGATESDQPELVPLRPPSSDERLPLFGEAGGAGEVHTIARQLGPVTATATSYGEPFAFVPERRPVMAIDGDPGTAWTVGEHADPVGEMLRLSFASGAPATATLHQAVVPGGRRITELSIGGRRIALDDSSADGTGQMVELPTGAGSVDLTIVAVGGGQPGTAGAVAAVGFSEVDTGAQPTVEVVRPPVDGLDALPDSAALTFVFTRWRADPYNRWRSDPEPVIERLVPITSPRPMTVAAEVRVDPRSSDADLAAIFGWPARASTRLLGSLGSAGISAIDGDASTAWVSGFGAGVGATLSIDTVAAPIDRITITQPAGSFSRITSVVVRAGGQQRQLELAGGSTSATIEVEPPLPAGSVELIVDSVEPATVVDRRYGDVVELPVAISEIELAGLPQVIPVGSASARVECVPLLSIGDTSLAYSVDIDASSALTGAALPVEPCQGEVDVRPGDRLSGRAIPGLQVDRVVLESGTLPTATPAPAVTQLGSGRFERTLRVDGCAEGCWLVLGEGFNSGWKATVDGSRLADPVLVDGGFNGWRLDADAVVTLTWVPQRRLTAALLLTVAGVAIAVATLVASWARDRRRPAPPTRPDAVPDATPALALPAPLAWRSAGRASSVAIDAAIWAVAAGALIDPRWALVGAVVGAAASGRARIGELTAWTTLAVVAALVVVRERRSAPAPNGGWPGTFESWHALAMFAVVAVLASAVRCDDAGATAGEPSEHAEPSEHG